MNATATPTVRLTRDEYLTRERLAESRSGYVDGVVYAMAYEAIADFGASGVQVPLAAIYERIDFEELPVR